MTPDPDIPDPGTPLVTRLTPCRTGYHTFVVVTADEAPVQPDPFAYCLCRQFKWGEVYDPSHLLSPHAQLAQQSRRD